jgi:hypothetical protein
MLCSQYLIMENNKNIASLVSFVSPLAAAHEGNSLILMSKAAGDAPLFILMKMIEDLGKQYPCAKSKVKKHFAFYECPLCGNPFRASVYAIKTGKIKACRCNVVKTFVEKNTKHGLSKHPLYFIFQSMHQRCLNINDKAYSEWGGRGIIICDEWKHNFMAFYTWAINNGYKRGLKLDRRDNDKEYSPDNCRWINDFISKQNTRIINARNTSGYRGIYFNKRGNRIKRWEACLMVCKKKHHLGYFLTPEQAAKAYNNFVTTHGTAHPLNFIK